MNDVTALSRRDAIKMALAATVAAHWPSVAAGQDRAGTDGSAAQDTDSTSTRPFHAWAATPPMGWNSWDSFGASVTEAEYLENARILAERFLPFGYDIATVDIQWYEPGAHSSQYRPFAPLRLDAHGRPQPAPNRFPSAARGAGFALVTARDVLALHLSPAGGAAVILERLDR